MKSEEIKRINKNNIAEFSNTKFGSIRAESINGTPWFVGKDVAIALGYKNASKAIMNHVDNEDKAFMMVFNTDSQNGNVPTFATKTTFINESGLYSLILSSKLDSAKDFKRWVTSEILPTIRKTGGYVNNDEMFINTYLPNADEQTKIMFKSSLTAIRELNGKIDTLNGEIKKLDGQVSELGSKVEVMTPKAEYYDDVLQSEGLVSITTIAKDYGKSALWMNNFLHQHKVQFKQNNTWVLYAKHSGKGYTKSKTYYNEKTGRSKVTMYWTQKGREAIDRMMKYYGYERVG